MVTERIVFQGQVQGVGFRATAHRLAQARPVLGSVRNLRDGSVELIVQAEADTVDEFLTAIQDRFRGHILRIDRQAVEPAESYTHFEIRY